MSAAAPIAGFFAAAGPVMADDADARQKSLLSTVTDPQSNDTQRQNAAAELVTSDTADTGGAVLTGLQKKSSAEGRLALIKAIASASSPNRKWIDALGNLLGADRSQTRAAAQALANYPGNADAFLRLKNFADSNDVLRAEAIRAMGALIDKEPAEYLVHVLTAANQTEPVRDAAARALSQMTGINSYGNSVAQWQQWWTNAAGKTPEQFRAMLLAGRAADVQRMRQLQEDAGKLISELYYGAPNAEKKAELALKYLNADSAVVRQDVIALIDANLQANSATDEVKNRLVEMIDDPDEQVRQSVVNVLMTAVSDPGKLPKLVPALINRLKIEPNPQVKAKIAIALGKFADAKAVPVLVELLKDPDPDVATAAARALSGTLGSTLHHDDPAAAQAASATIRKLLADNANQPPDQKSALVAALAALQDQASFDVFMNLVLPDQTPDVRRSALQGLALLGNHTAIERLKTLLENGRDASIRLEAARTLGAVADPADAAYIKIGMVNDLDPKVRAALREALQKVFDKMTPDDLTSWANTFNNPPDKDPELRLVALLKKGNALKARGGNTADDDIAGNQEDLAEAMMAVTPPRRQEAIDNLKASLEHRRATVPRAPGWEEGSIPMVQLIQELLDAELSARQYKEATDFGAAQLAIKQEYQKPVGSTIKNEADRLRTVDRDAAKTLIEDALQMTPPLDAPYVSQLQAIEKQLNAAKP
jgi:HEAT repeat protein